MADNVVRLLQDPEGTRIVANDNRELAKFPDYGAALDYCNRMGYAILSEPSPAPAATPAPAMQAVSVARQPGAHMLELANQMQSVVDGIREGRVLGVAYTVQHLEPGSGGRTETNFGWDEQPVIVLGGLEVLKNRIMTFLFKNNTTE